jgi:fatty-acid desaturase
MNLLSWKPKRADLSSLSLCRLGALIAIHAGALAAPFYLSWQGVICCIVLVIMTGHLGVGLGFHRLLTHRSFGTSNAFKYLLALFGTLALQTGPVSWVADHRLHHKKTDQDDDPHTPRYSLLWAHLGWTVFVFPERPEVKHRMARDISRDVVLMFLDNYTWVIGGLCFLLLFMVGYCLDGVDLGLSLLLWGGCLRTVYVWHSTFIVNSICHMQGYRNYPTSDGSRNSWLGAILAQGEAWHNNHHAFPRSAGHGHRVLELDPLYLLLRVLEKIRIVRKVIRPPSLRSDCGMKVVKETVTSCN